MELFDFSKCLLSDKNLTYAGRAGRKRGIIFSGENFILKFSKNTIGMQKVNDIKYTYSYLSEYIGSSIFNILGIEAQKTYLGVCHDGINLKPVVAIKDFLKDDEILIQYTAIRNDTNEDIMRFFDQHYQSSSYFEEIIFQLNHNTIFKKIPNIKKHFFEMLVVDYLINNNDRNEDNFGVIYNKTTHDYRFSPIYDNGNSFYSKSSDNRLEDIISNEERFKDSCLGTVSSFEDEKGCKIPMKKIIRMDIKELKEGIQHICEIASNNTRQIIDLINDIPSFYMNVNLINDIRKKYYIESFLCRLKELKKIIKEELPRY